MPRPFDQLVQTISGEQTPRVWSLLVTVFGELAQEDGARIHGQTLSQLADLIGIRPEALRVALHRLRKDGWIDSIRTGRTSAHELTDFGRTRSAEASPRIYATAPRATEAWLILCNPGEPAPDFGVGVAPHVQISTTCPSGDSAFCTPIHTSTDLPGWITERVCPADLATQSRDLLHRLQNLRDHVGAYPLSPAEIAALRVLIVHSWRRIVLKAPDLPDHVFPSAWAGPECRTLVADLLTRLPQQTLPALETEQQQRAG